MKNVIYKSVVSYKEFIDNMPFGLTYTESTPTLNQWTYVTEENSAHINTGEEVVSFIRLRVGKLYVGDILNLSADFLNIDGVEGKIGVDYYSDETSFNNSSSDRTTVEIVNSNKSDRFEKTELNLPVTQNGYYDVNFGIWTNDIGQFKIRRITCGVNTIANRNSLINDRIRKATIYNPSTGNFVLKDDKYNDPCSISTIWDDKAIQITFDYPLDYSGTPFINQESYSNTRKYLFRASYGTKNSVVIEVYDLLAEDPTASVAISSLPNNTYIDVMLIA